MLTGDNKATAKWVLEQIRVDEYFAEVLPKDKAAQVKEIQARGHLVAITGDGVNDAPALAQADLGIAIGTGSDVAVETAAVILVRSSPLDVIAILRLAAGPGSRFRRRTRKPAHADRSRLIDRPPTHPSVEKGTH